MSLKELVEDSAWLFDLGFPIVRIAEGIAPEKPALWSLGEEYRLPALNVLSPHGREFLTKMAWGPEGIFLEIEHPNAPVREHFGTGFSSILQFFIDTRSSPGIHRANSHCHGFDIRLKLPNMAEFQHRPMEVSPKPIPRAKSLPKMDHFRDIGAWCSASQATVRVQVFLPVHALTGCDPMEFPEWGLMFVLLDSKYQKYALARMSVAIPLDDPSLWCRARLVGPKSR